MLAYVKYASRLGRLGCLASGAICGLSGFGRLVAMRGGRTGAAACERGRRRKERREWGWMRFLGFGRLAAVRGGRTGAAACERGRRRKERREWGWMRFLGFCGWRR